MCSVPAVHEADTCKLCIVDVLSKLICGFPIPPAVQLIKGTRAVFMNGFVFDELPLDMVVSAINLAHSMGAAIFFDPGIPALNSCDCMQHNLFGSQLSVCLWPVGEYPRIILHVVARNCSVGLSLMLHP
jgi:hypothetical protein